MLLLCSVLLLQAMEYINKQREYNHCRTANLLLSRVNCLQIDRIAFDSLIADYLTVCPIATTIRDAPDK